MRQVILIFFLFASIFSSAQLSFPKGFRLVPGDNGAGEDDVYTNGRYSFQTHQVFRSYGDYNGNDEKFKNYVAKAFEFPFFTTRDGLLWGTGKTQGFYSYIVVSWDGEAFELFSSFNDEGFSRYSKWLLSTIRDLHKQGKPIMFPLTDNVQRN